MNRLFSTPIRHAVAPRAPFQRSTYCSGCRYKYDAPAFTPFWASIVVGSLYTYLLMIQSRRQYENLYLELNEIKEAQKAQLAQREKR